MKIGTSTVTAIYLGTTSIVSAYLGSTQVFGGASAFTPLDLFSTGSQGIWLDPSDLTTMFSDRAGTIPITTPGTVVGKRLDKSGRGNHAVAPTDAARPIYGVEPKGGRRNLLTWSEDFRNTAAAGEVRPWVWFNTTIDHNVAVAPNGTMTADRIITNTTSAQHSWYRTFAAAAGTNTATISVKANGYNTVQLYMFNGAANVGTATARLDLGTVTIGGSGSPAGSIASEGNGWYRITLTATSANSVELGLYVGNNGSVSAYAGDNTSGVFCWGAQLELGSTATNYQRVLSAYDITESGVATCHYVQYDGSDDSMSTAAIDFTATDKMSVFAGVRKLSDAAVAVLAETSALFSTSSGTFLLLAPADGGTGNYGFNVNVTSGPPLTLRAATFSAPISNVVTGVSDIAASTRTIRVNGGQIATSTSSLPAGNFGNYPLYIGRRNNATLPFSGKDYGIIVVGKAASAGEITDTELWLSDKTAEVDVAKSISPNIYTRSGGTILTRANSIIERRA